jgi:hypothetical protein
MFRTYLTLEKTPLQESLLHPSVIIKYFMIENGNTINYLRDKKKYKKFCF